MELKQKHAFLTLFILFIFAFSISNFSQKALSFDTTPPKVESCTISPREISDAVGGTVKVTIKVVSKSGLTSNVLSVLNLKNNTTGSTRQLGGFIMNRVSGDEFSGTWVQDIPVRAGLFPGIYELTIFPLTDSVQNGTGFLSCPGQEVSYGVPAPAASPTSSPSLTPTPSPKPTPVPTVTVTATPLPAATVYIANPVDESLRNQLTLLRTELSQLEKKLKKVCSAKPKPKGC
jgi:hypothetical protein